jgi:hypothetical protein
VLAQEERDESLRHAYHVAPSIRKRLALTSLTSGGSSVGIVRLRTEAKEFSFLSWRNILSRVDWINVAQGMGQGTVWNTVMYKEQKIRQCELLNWICALWC